jgi:hypothetical protein
MGINAPLNRKPRRGFVGDFGWHLHIYLGEIAMSANS